MLVSTLTWILEHPQTIKTKMAVHSTKETHLTSCSSRTTTTRAFSKRTSSMARIFISLNHSYLTSSRWVMPGRTRTRTTTTSSRASSWWWEGRQEVYLATSMARGRDRRTWHSRTPGRSKWERVLETTPRNQRSTRRASMLTRTTRLMAIGIPRGITVSTY